MAEDVPRLGRAQLTKRHAAGRKAVPLHEFKHVAEIRIMRRLNLDKHHRKRVIQPRP